MTEIHKSLIDPSPRIMNQAWINCAPDADFWADNFCHVKKSLDLQVYNRTGKAMKKS